MQFIEINKHEDCNDNNKQLYIPIQNLDYIKRRRGGYATIVLKSGKEIKTKHYVTYLIGKIEELNKTQTLLKTE